MRVIVIDIADSKSITDTLFESDQYHRNKSLRLVIDCSERATEPLCNDRAYCEKVRV